MSNPIPPASGVAFAATARTTLKRHPERGRFDRSQIHAILDEALVCHAAVTVDAAPAIVPFAHARIEEHLYLHGARANRILGVLARGAQTCIAVTLLDGLVFARTWFHHSMNFRSLVVYGFGSEVVDPDEKIAALGALIDKAAPGRTRESRPPTADEMRSTLVVRVPIVEVSAKIRTGPPLDGPELLSDDCWAGELPLRLAPLSPKDDERLGPGVSLSEAVERRARTLAPSPFQHDERRRGDVVVTTDPGRIDFAFVHRFLSEESYWARGIEPSELRIALRHSLLFGLFRGDKQIGFARVVTDMARFAYLGDVFVEPDARGQGLGTWLVASVLDHPDLRTVDRWVLLTQDAHGLYARFGFEPAEAGRTMVRESSRGDPSGA